MMTLYEDDGEVRIPITIQIDLSDEEIDNRQVHRTVICTVRVDTEQPRGVVLEGDAVSLFLRQDAEVRDADALGTAIATAIEVIDAADPAT
jgi:hypothetical protein